MELEVLPLKRVATCDDNDDVGALNPPSTFVCTCHSGPNLKVILLLQGFHLGRDGTMMAMVVICN